MFCANCGASLLADAQFCMVCGKKVGKAPTAVAPARRGGISPGQWVGAAFLAALVGLPIGTCSFFVAGAMAGGSTTAGLIALIGTVVLAFLMAAGSIKNAADRRELQQRMLEDLRQRQR